MGIEESLFGWLYRRISMLARREPPELAARAVDTERLLPRLRVLASAAADRTVEVRVVDGEGGLAGDVVLLPRRVLALSTPADNERLLLVRATLAGAMVRAGVGAVAPTPEALSTALPGVERALAEELPGWAAMRAELPAELPTTALTGTLFAAPAPLASPSPTADAHQLPREVTTERASHRRAPPRRKKRLIEDDKAENPLTHSFEKVHTAEEHRGGSKRIDGSDELDDHLAALDEVDLDEVVVSGERTRSIYQAEASFGPDATGGGGGSNSLSYDEWDPKRQSYLSRHCAVTVERPEVIIAAGTALRSRVVRDERRALGETRAQLARLDTALRWHTRQPDGSDVDLDALVDRASCLSSGHEGPSRLYVSRRKRGHSVALLLLVDASMSTDGWIANRRVLELEREAATIVGLAFDGVVGELAIAAFCSFSHADCRFVELKSFDEPLSRGLARLAHLEPRGYTRMGPALRHATALLDATASRRKAILLLSDGKPTDTDRYEGRHGIGDVRQAVREAKQRGVDVFALSADPRSKPLLPQMFGARGHAGLATPRDVARAVGDLVTQLMR
ncbi:MAG: VWA domain-containing protein [Myxococcales bacterium]|nr:VWA domain-containing protein [Myxococcales bacterium]